MPPIAILIDKYKLSINFEEDKAKCILFDKKQN